MTYRFLTPSQLLEVFRLVEGMEPQVRDLGAIDAAIHRQHSSSYGQELYPTLDLKVAAMMDSLARSHPLLDGNKRLTLLAGLVTFRLNGRGLVNATADSLTDLILRISSDHMPVTELADILATTFVTDEPAA